MGGGLRVAQMVRVASLGYPHVISTADTVPPVVNVRVAPCVVRPIAREGEVDHAVHVGRAAGAMEILAGVIDGLARTRSLCVGRAPRLN